MGWRGILRSIAAEQRRAERESVRRQRQLERLHKAEAKLQALEEAKYEVEAYENLIERIRSVHCDCGEAWNWKSIAATTPPKEPILDSTGEQAAQLRLDRYRPVFFVRLFGLTEWRRRSLAAAIEAARRSDAEAYARARKEFEEKYAEWEEATSLAQRMLRHEPSAFREALEEINPLAELSELGSRVVFTFADDGRTSVVLHVNGESVVPPEVKTLLKSGKVSKKKMPTGQFYELYQDYVCGGVFRVARECLALLPLDSLVITAMGHMLDTSTGHMADQPILSVLMPRKTIESINFDSVDPSDALRNFIHRMDFKKTKGFHPVEPLTFETPVLG